MRRVENKVVIVTGAASGMGRAHVLALVREGARVVVTDLNEEGGAETVRLANAEGGEAVFVRHDAASEGDWKNMMDTAIATFGKLDVLVNNAGVYVVGNAEDLTLEQWDFVFGVNTRGTFIGVHLAIPHMKRAGGGSIINVSSNFALVGRAGFSAYCASKGAVRAFTKAVAAELASDNIRVNSLHPGLVATPMTADLISTQEGLDMLLGGAPLRRAAAPEEIASAVVYLASDESRFMIGAEMVVDGGYVAV